MRILMLSKALVVGAYQKKAEELARLPGVELTVAVPPLWREPGVGPQELVLLCGGPRARLEVADHSA